MASVTSSRRRSTALAERQVAKERRQRILAIGGVVLLGLLLAYEVPHTLHLVNKSSSSSSSSAPPVPVISVSTPTASVPVKQTSDSTRYDCP